MTTSDDEWGWRFTDPAERDYEGLATHETERIVSKLDAIVTDQWRDPDDYLEPLTGAPHSKLRIGAFRLGCATDRDAQLLDRVAKRSRVSIVAELAFFVTVLDLRAPGAR